ncbi:MAG: pyridoxal-dependent decarboxylase [Bacteroidota bacterium]
MKQAKSNLAFSENNLQTTFQMVLDHVTQYHRSVSDFDVMPTVSQDDIKKRLRRFDFNNADRTLEDIIDLLNDIETCSLNVSSPNYFGLFTPKVLLPTIIADVLTTAYNPNLGSWDHAPYFVELESYLIQQLGEKFGYPDRHRDGVFTSGGTEGNLYGVLCALNYSFNRLNETGIQGIKEELTVYCSAEAHHSVVKALKAVGLGSKTLRMIPTRADLVMDTKILEIRIKEDLTEGKRPLMIIATAGTTGAGAIDELDRISSISKAYGIWFHVDAAYGGALIFSSRYKKLLKGIDHSDSISFDLHKWPALAVGTCVFLTRHNNILRQVFEVETNYMPRKTKQATDPYLNSLSWSRRSIGFRFYIALFFFGWKGFEELIDSHIRLGRYFSKVFKQANWKVIQVSALPILCFTHPDLKNRNEKVQAICDEVVGSGKAWISTYKIYDQLYFRACIINSDTRKPHIEQLLELMNNKIRLSNTES